MAIICPTVTAYSAEEFNHQLKTVQPFAKRIHLDFMDGEFAPTKTPPLTELYWPKNSRFDMHVMYKRPLDHLDDIIAHHPHLVIVHQEAENIANVVHELHEQRIKVGIALLQTTVPETLHQYSGVIDHILVFSGNLGYHGGTADLSLLDKVRHIKTMWPHIEIGWDGGVNAENVRALADGGVDVLNVGGAIQKVENPRRAYNTMVGLLQS